MSPAPYTRGRIVLADFPYVENPHRRGPKQHFCMLVGWHEIAGKPHAALCYSTSRLDEDLLQSYGGALLSVPLAYIKVSRGFMTAPVTHFVTQHIALVPEDWIDLRFDARLDFIREDRRHKDPVRERLYRSFASCERLMIRATTDVVRYCEEAGQVGLPSRSFLR